MRYQDLMDSLKSLYEERDEALRGVFDRSLPFQDGIFDRWDRARRLGFGSGASIYNSSLVFGKVAVGEESWIGPYTLLDGSGGGIVIGHHCSVSAGVHIYTHDTVHWSLSAGRSTKKEGAVRVGDCTYIGSHSILNVGINVGSHSVIAANCFANHDVPDFTIVAGTPARKIGIVEIEGDEIKLNYDEN